MGDSYRTSRYGGDSYYPRRSRSRSPRRDDMYRFGGNIRGNDANPRQGYDNGSSHSRGDFTFRKESQFQWPTEPRADRSRPRNGTRNGHNNRGGRGGRWQPRGSKAANDRQILNTVLDRDVTPERLAGMANGVHLFNPDDIGEDDLENASDSAMSESSSEGFSAADRSFNELVKDDSEEGPSKKRAKKQEGEADGNSKPKWSNPDPYYALPPVIEDANAKKKDVVELIRKAKVATEKENEQSSNAVTQNDDFISFGMDEEDHVSISSDDTPTETFTQGTVNDSRAPGEDVSTSDSIPFSHLTNLQPLLANSSAVTSSRLESNGDTRREVQAAQNNVQSDSWPPRSKEDAINPPQRREQPPKQRGSKRKRGDISGDIMQEWIEDSYAHAVPWLKEDHSNSKSTAVWLHKEICDFVEFVKPTAHEHAIRSNLVERISRAFQYDYPEYTLHSFGSYAYGIYLPTADMDLCLVSDRFHRTGFPDFNPSGNQLRKFMICLDKAGITDKYGQQIVAKAKVPIIKFVDRLTGLKVDISFENTTGITALSSFNAWKATYPQFTPLVTLVKQFLLMRDLNEVFTGGLGGFSVACLVVSMLQHSPDIQSANPPTLGALLLRFLKLYGNDFNMTTLGISVNPPMYLRKVRRNLHAQQRTNNTSNTNTL
jgi:non-canonical poly(A) RNA polymerase PAPD5/7